MKNNQRLISELISDLLAQGVSLDDIPKEVKRILREKEEQEEKEKIERKLREEKEEKVKNNLVKACIDYCETFFDITVSEEEKKDIEQIINKNLTLFNWFQ